MYLNMNINYLARNFSLALFLVFGFCFISQDNLSARDSLWLPSIIGDHMVLQRGMILPIWGQSKPGDFVSVSIAGQKLKSKTNAQGRWRVDLDPLSAGGPYVMTVQTDDKTIKIRDILIGENWIGSGQSNMQWSMTQSDNAGREIAAANYPEIRLFYVKRETAKKAKEDCTGEWLVCSPESVAGFSAVSYYFGKELFNKLQIPIGLIHSSWGGSPAESWMSPESMATNPDYQTLQYRYDNAMKQYELDRPIFDKQLETLDSSQNISAEQLVGTWDFVTGISPDESSSSMSITLKNDQPQVDMDWTSEDSYDTKYNDGSLTWTYNIPVQWYPDPFTVSAKFNTNTFTGTFQTPKTDPHPIKGVKRAGSQEKRSQLVPPNAMPRPSSLWNAMIKPLAPFAIKGVIWYQGESNAGRAFLYRELFPTMIEDWRKLWQQGDFPFYYVQIAPYRYGEELIAAELREAQLMSLDVKNTGMVVTSDIGNIEDIHPTNKHDVGKRLALWALAKNYGRADIVPSGPLYSHMKRKGRKIHLYFDHVGSGLVAKGGKLTEFTISGDDRNFISAAAKIKRNKIVVRNNGIKRPVAVRYGWSNIAEPNLFNKEGLPASTFRTDDWPGVTSDISKYK